MTNFIDDIHYYNNGDLKIIAMERTMGDEKWTEALEKLESGRLQLSIEQEDLILQIANTL